VLAAYSLLKDRVISDITTRQGYQAMAAQHRSSTTAGRAGLVQQAVPFPLVACNLAASAEPSRPA
jgi:hypothetical protein